jgi:hypothetical protein
MIIMRHTFNMRSLMTPRYKIGQKVVITPVKNQNLSSRDSGLEPYAGQVGEVVHYHWISPDNGTVFYIYTARMETDGKEVVVHEDELQPYASHI